ncbi:MAG: HTTM domain-containing protein [Armatimonadetes bacterium]|nr:HTTM domain-containing protein [Armatimonadota bacterium]
MNWLRALLNPFRQFGEWLFGYGSPVTMGLFRAVFGGLIFTNLMMISIDFEAWFTEKGFTPVYLLEYWNGDVIRYSPLANVTDSRITLLAFIVTTLAALFTSLGLFSRVSSVVLLLGLTAFHLRNPDILHSGDTLMRAMALYIALSPSGAACSIDRLIGLWRGKAPLEPLDVSLWPQRMMQIQLALVYFATAWHKSFGDWWLNGTATYYLPHLDEFDRFPVPAWVDHPIMISASTWFTLLMEVALATLIFSKPFRKWVLLGGILLHVGIEYRMNIPLFAFIITSCYITFYEGTEVTLWASRVGQRLKKWQLSVQMPSGRELRKSGLAVLSAVDPFGLVTYNRGETGDWRSLTPSGTAVAFTSATLARSPGAWLLWLWPPAWRRLCDRALATVEDSDATAP